MERWATKELVYLIHIIALYKISYLEGGVVVRYMITWNFTLEYLVVMSIFAGTSDGEN